jgi:hypothetical protein
MGGNIAVGGIASQNSSNISAGIEIMKTLDETETIRFFALGGVGYHHNSNTYQTTDTTTPANPGDPMNPPPMIEETDHDTTINAGVGLGVEYAPSGLKKKGVAFSLDCAYAVTFEKLTNNYTANKSMHYTGLAPLPSFSIIYYFKR